jgi:hypothetical protein
MEQVRAGAPRLLENTPASQPWADGRLAVSEAVVAVRKYLPISECMGFATNKIVHGHEGPYLAAHHVGLRRNSKPFVERAALI